MSYITFSMPKHQYHKIHQKTMILFFLDTSKRGKKTGNDKCKLTNS